TDARHILVPRERLHETDRTMILEDEVRSERRGELLPVARRQSSPQAQIRLPGGGLWSGLACAVVRVELGVGPIEVLEVERDERHEVAAIVDLDEQQVLDLARADEAVGATPAVAAQHQSVAPRREHLAR